MKNIHILPTDKPSRLWLSTRNENYLIFDKFPRDYVEYVEPKNIYITFDEEIKDNTWVLNIVNGVIYKTYSGINFNLDTEKERWRKIILTTDQDLIKYGVQAVDKEFLEWFCSKNGKVDFVEVIAIKDEKN